MCYRYLLWIPWSPSKPPLFNHHPVVFQRSSDHLEVIQWDVRIRSHRPQHRKDLPTRRHQKRDVHRFREGPETPQKSMGLEMKSHLWAHRIGGLNIEFVIIGNHGWKPPWKPWSNMCLCHFLTTVGQSYKDTAYPLICRPRLEAAADSSSVLDRLCPDKQRTAKDKM